MAEKRRIQEPPIRIKPASRATVQEIADAIGVPYILIVDWAIEALGAYWEAHNRRLLLPLDFRERFTVQSEPPMVLPDPPPYENELESTRAGASRRSDRSARPRGVQA